MSRTGYNLNDAFGLPDLEFTSALPRTFSDQEITVINDPNQLNFLTPFAADEAGFHGGYSSASDADEAVETWGGQFKTEPSRITLSPQNQPGGHVGFSQMPEAHSLSSSSLTSAVNAAPEEVSFGAPSMGLSQSLQPSLQTMVSHASSPSKRMKRRLSNPHNSPVLAAQAQAQGMLRTTSVPVMGTNTRYNLLAASAHVARQNQAQQQQASSALPPLKPARTVKTEKPKRAPRRRVNSKTKNGSEEKSSRRNRHNESERVRMRTIAAKINEMKELMEETGFIVPKEKAKILTGAVEYVKHLKKVASQKTAQVSQLEGGSTFYATPLPSCLMDATCNLIDANPHFKRYFGQPHKPFPSAVLLVPDWIYGRCVPEKVSLWLDLVQNLRNEHSRVHGMQLEDQCIQHNGRPVNFRIVATLVNYHPSSSIKDIRILLTLFPLPPQGSCMTQLIPIKNYEYLHHQTSVQADAGGNQSAADGGQSKPRFSK